MRLTGGQILARYLVRQGVPYAVGIPGHGCWAIVDAFADFSDRLTTLQVMHEQSAAHLADGYYRGTGRPLMAFTSIGPGAVNTAVGIATAYVDSTAVLLVTGSPHTYMRGRAVLQEIERTQWANFPRMMEPIVKRYWQAGGGVIPADASAQLVALAEHLGAPVVTTWMGKGAIPEDHELNAWSVGDTASTSGNAIARTADVLLAVGCRFTDWSASSYRRGVTLSLPP